MKRLNVRDIVGGLLVGAVGLYFLAGALRMRLGSALEMGPGYFPMLVGGLTVALGVVMVVMAIVSSGRFESLHWRPMLAVLASVGGFALFVNWFGLIPAMAVGVALAALGDRTSRPVQTVVLAAGAAIGAWLIFRVGLDLQMPGLMWPTWAGGS